MNFDELLDSATPHSIDVSLCVDGALQAQVGELVAQWQAAQKAHDTDPRLGVEPETVKIAKQIEALQEQMRDRLVTIRITQMPGAAWSRLTLKYPVGKSPGPYDKTNGFNVEATCRAALLSHAGAVEGDEVVPLDAGQWQRLFDTITGGDFNQLLLSTLSVNQLSGQIAVSTLEKGSRKTSNSATN